MMKVKPIHDSDEDIVKWIVCWEFTLKDIVEFIQEKYFKAMLDLEYRQIIKPSEYHLLMSQKTYSDLGFNGLTCIDDVQIIFNDTLVFGVGIFEIVSLG